ncbi:MAG: acyltransferase family protein [Alphaproteobacteria bacterium]|nr:acyltransferase family protein [Alphaproteobacteria bacterium]
MDPGKTPAQPTGGQYARREDIQGLRAIAVLAVLFFHANEDLLPGGFVGVDIFFVLSGFLITGVLLRPMEGGAFSILDFYRRRIRRLFPALFAMLFAALVAGLVYFPPVLLKSFLESQFFTTLFASNFYFLDKTGYFDLQADLMPLLHTWSLGVEEQFYIFYPLLLWSLYRWARPFLIPALALGALVSLGYAQALLTSPLPGPAELAFYSPFSRAFELFIGALCLFASRRFSPAPRIANPASAAALIALAASFLLIGPGAPFPGALALAPCLATATLLLAQKSFAARILAARPLVAIGDMSYSLYLWHWPAFVFARFLAPDSPIALGVAGAFAFAAAALSWRYVEKPFLDGRARPPILLLGASAIAASILISLPIYLAHGLPSRFPPRAQAFIAAANDYNHDRKRCHMRSDRPIPYADTCVYGDNDAKPSVAVWGDSHGAELAPILGAKISTMGLSLRSITMSGCRPETLSANPVCARHNARVLSAIKADPAMRTVVLTANLYGDDDFARRSVKGIEETALELEKAGKHVIIVQPIPTFDFDPPSMLALAARAGRNPAEVGMTRARFEERSGRIDAELSEFRRLHHIAGVKPSDIYCDAQRCRAYRKGVGALYFNHSHLSMTGVALLADAIVPLIAVKTEAEALPRSAG